MAVSKKKNEKISDSGRNSKNSKREVLYEKNRKSENEKDHYQ